MSLALVYLLVATNTKEPTRVTITAMAESSAESQSCELLAQPISQETTGAQVDSTPVISGSFGATEQQSQPGPEPVFNQLARRGMLLETNVTLPLVLKESKTSMELNSNQVETLGWLRQEFETALGPNRDPNDPDYLGRWMEAQRASDAMLRGLLGQDFYARYRMTVLGESE